MRDWIFNARKEKCRRDSGQRTMQAGSMGETSWRAMLSRQRLFRPCEQKAAGRDVHRQKHQEACDQRSQYAYILCPSSLSIVLEQRGVQIPVAG